MNRKFNIEETLKLYNLGFTDKEIANILGCTANQFAKHRERVLKVPVNKPAETMYLTSEEREILIGTLLGDSNVRYVHKKCKYPTLNFTHCEKQKEWATWKANKLKRLCASFKPYLKQSGFNTHKSYTYQFTGKNLKCLSEIRETFYKNNIKVIPMEYIKQYMSDLSLYCLMMDDGHYDKSSNSFGISLYCFTRDNLKEFCSFLKEKFNLNFTIKKDGSLYLKHESNQIMTSILNKYNECPSMNYKCSSR